MYLIQYELSEKRESPNLMACSKVGYGKCSRCGSVGKTHFGRPWVGHGAEQQKKGQQELNAFFSKKKKFPSKAQLRLFKEQQ